MGLVTAVSIWEIDNLTQVASERLFDAKIRFHDLKTAAASKI